MIGSGDFKITGLPWWEMKGRLVAAWVYGLENASISAKGLFFKMTFWI